MSENNKIFPDKIGVWAFLRTIDKKIFLYTIPDKSSLQRGICYFDGSKRAILNLLGRGIFVEWLHHDPNTIEVVKNGSSRGGFGYDADKMLTSDFFVKK